MSPTNAMLLAAGLARRMRPLTDTTAKPLLTLRGRTLLDHALDRLAEAGVTDVVVNAHWHADQVAAACAARSHPRIALQREDALLETGGSVRRALPLLGDAPFHVVNGDAFWLNGPTPALCRLAAAFDPASMDALLLVARTSLIPGDVGLGDFALDPLGRVRRRKEREIAPDMYAGVQLAAPAMFAAGPDGFFSTNLVWDRAIEAGRLFALVHDGPWFHLSTPADLAEAEHLLAHDPVR